MRSVKHLKFVALLLLSIPLAGWSDDAKPSSFDLAALTKLLEKNPKTIDELLALLPAEYRDHFTLAYDSKSLQTATPEDPRAVVFGADGKLVLTFIGSDDPKRGGDRIEIMAYDNKAKKFEMREIKQSKEGLSLSHSNPTQCLECHGNPPHPIWEDYFSWPGFYGSADDRLYRGREGILPAKDEKSNFKHFWTDIKPKHSRYKTLGPSKADPADVYQYEDDDIKYYRRPNLQLTRIFTEQTAAAAARIYAESADNKSLIRLLAWGSKATAGCDNLDDDLLKYIDPPIPSKDQDPHYLEIGKEFSRIVGIHFAVAKKEGTVVRSKEKDAVLFDGFSFGAQSMFYELIDYIKGGAGKSFKEKCDLLRKEIIATFKNPPDTCDQPQDEAEKIAALGPIKHFVDTLKRGPTLAKMCANCHSDKTTEAPMIPFGDEAELKKWFKQDSKRIKSVLSRINPETKEGRMPPTKPVEGEDAVALKAYLEMLSNEK